MTFPWLSRHLENIVQLTFRKFLKIKYVMYSNSHGHNLENTRMENVANCFFGKNDDRFVSQSTQVFQLLQFFLHKHF
jgi:hypothetical protein